MHAQPLGIPCVTQESQAAGQHAAVVLVARVRPQTRAPRSPAGRHRRRSSRWLGWGSTPSACWMMPTSSTRVSRCEAARAWKRHVRRRMPDRRWAGRARSPRASTIGRLASDLRPGQLRCRPRGPARRVRCEPLGIVEQVVRPPRRTPRDRRRARARRRRRPAGPRRSSTGVEIVGTAGDDGEGQRAGDDLLARPVRGQVDRRRGKHGREIVDGEEAIVENDVVARGRGPGRGARASEPVAPRPRYLATSGWVWPATTYCTSGWRSTIARQWPRSRSRCPCPARSSPKVARTHLSSADGAHGLGLVAARQPQAPSARRPSAATRSAPPCGTTRTRSGRTRRASMTMRRAVSVKTQTSAARSHSARSVSAWPTDGADRTVCSVKTIGWCSWRASESTC